MSVVISVTQFMMPNGRQVEQTTTVPDDCAVGYESMRRHGCRLTAEMLSDFKAVSLCIEHPEYGDYAIEVVPNGPEVPAALSKMLREFDGAEFEKWVKEAA